MAGDGTTAGRGSSTIDDLVGRVADGDGSAFDLLLSQTTDRLRSIAEWVLRDPSHAEEVVQEIYLEIWQTAGRFDRRRGSALAWMSTMTRRRSIDRVRATQASRDRDHRIAMRDHEDPRDPVAASGELKIEWARARRSLDRLSRVQRRAIELAFIEGYQMTEVAAITGVPLTTAKTRIRDGLTRMRAELAS